MAIARMWRTVRSLLTLATGFAAPALAFDPAAELDAYVARAVEEWEVPGLAIAVVKDGVVVFARGYGGRELGRAGAVDEHTLFAIGSTTKAMTAATVALQVDAGRLGWDDRVEERLPWFRLADPWTSRELTVRDLLTHRAGLGNADFLWYGSDRSRREILEKVALLEPAYSLRDGFVYQNILYVAAGEVAATAAGATWEELLVGGILEPLGMERTVVSVADTTSRANVASPHDRVDGTLRVIENPVFDSVAPAGTVWSSVHDMGLWLRMLLAEGEAGEGRILATESVAELLRPQTLLDLSQLYPGVPLLAPHWTSYALGWFQLDYRGRAVSFHTGSIDGMSALVGLVPDGELGVVVLANRDHAELRHALLWKTLDLWAGEAAGRDWSAELKALYDGLAAEEDERRAERDAARVAGTAPSLPLAAYAGTYVDPVYDEVEVELRAGGLGLRIGPTLSGALEHWHHDTFRMTFDRAWRGDALVTFTLGADARPARLEVAGLAFARREEPVEE